MYPMGAVVVVATAPVQQAASRVEKATSHLFMGPDLAINLKTCDILNAIVWQTKDVVKAMKKRLQNKDPKVQFYALMLLETMMKNNGEYVQFEVSEQHVLQEMINHPKEGFFTPPPYFYMPLSFPKFEYMLNTKRVYAKIVSIFLFGICFQNDMQVRGKVLLLLDSWQEAFGGPGGSVLPE